MNIRVPDRQSVRGVRRRIRWCVPLLMIAALFTACASRPSAYREVDRGLDGALSSEVAPGVNLARVNVVALPPLQVDPRTALPERYGSMLNERVQAIVADELLMKIVPLPTTSGKTPAEVRAEAAVAGADAVLLTELVNFRERDGSRLGAHLPAQVEVHFVLRAVPSGAELWRAWYHDTDRAVADDLVRAARRLERGEGPGWRSADELFVQGVRGAVRSLAARRVERFTATSDVGDAALEPSAADAG